jgi:hypothetical protein
MNNRSPASTGGDTIGPWRESPADRVLRHADVERIDDMWVWCLHEEQTARRHGLAGVAAALSGAKRKHHVQFANVARIDHRWRT